MKLKNQILIVLMFVGLIPAIFVGSLSYWQAKSEIAKDQYRKLEITRDLKKDQIINYFKEMINQVETIAMSQDTKMIFKLLKKHHDDMNVGANDPYPIIGEQYGNIWEQGHKLIGQYVSRFGYHDIFIICKKHGHVMFTDTKESDLGQNVGVGELKNSGLAKAWRGVVKDKKSILIDFEPYAPSNGAMASFMGTPVFIDGNMVAALVIQVPSIEIDRIMQNRVGMGESGESFLVAPDFKLRSDMVVNKGKIGDLQDGSYLSHVFAEKNNVGSDIEDLHGQEYLISYSNMDLKFFKWGVISILGTEESFKSVHDLRDTIIVIVFVIFIIVLIISFMMGKSIMKPINNMTLQVEELANDIVVGKLDSRGDENKTSIDFKVLITKINGLIEAFIRPINESRVVIKSMAEKNLTLRVDGNFEGDFLEYKNDINAAVKNLQIALQSVKKASMVVNSGAQQISSAAQGLSQGATEQASSVEEITSSTTEVGGQSKQNAMSANEAKTISTGSKDVADSGNIQMKELLNAITGISEASDNISKIIKVIDSIAFQTNLLALNAAVEAARAGVHGKGFAVVAEEVRNLAARSAKAAQETTVLIEDSLAKVASGKSFAESTATQLTEIVESSNKVLTLVTEIAESSHEQSEGVTQIASALEQVETVTQKNTATSEEVAAESQKLSSEAQKLATIVSEFKID